jgi:type IV pilus assembly protein PilM
MSIAAAFRPPTVGLDIGSSGVKCIALRQSRAGWSLAAASEAPLNLSEGPDSAAPDSFEVAAALSGHVIVKRLSLPAMNQAELAEAIPWEAEQYIPFDLADVQLDYQVVSSGATLDVLLVAAKRDGIDDRTALIEQAGRLPVVLDIEAFALVNAYQMNYPERSDPFAAIVHVGRSTTIACLLEDGQPAFTRDIAIGGRLYTDTLQRELGVDAATAERIQRGQIPNDVSREQVINLLRDATTQLILEIRKTVDFYRATAPVDKLSRLVVSGGACGAEGLVDMLAAEFNAPVDVFDPFRRITRPKNAVGADVVGPAYAVAVGLAMRREGDR